MITNISHDTMIAQLLHSSYDSSSKLHLILNHYNRITKVIHRNGWKLHCMRQMR